MNEITTREQFIRFVLQGLSNGTTMQIHEFKEHLTNIPCNKVIAYDARNVLAWAFLIYMATDPVNNQVQCWCRNQEDPEDCSRR